MKLGLLLKEYYDIRPPEIFKAPVGVVRSREEILDQLVNASKKQIRTLLTDLNSSIHGLSEEDAKNLLDKIYGTNEIVHEVREPALIRFLLTFYNALTILLLCLVLVSYVTGDMRSVVVIGSIVLLSVILKFYQEEQAYNAAEKLRSFIKTTCTIIRNEKSHEINIINVVPGDIIQLSAGDIVPADIRLIQSKDLFINQSLLTGESLPVEKHAEMNDVETTNPLELTNLVFAGTNVETGSAIGIVIDTGSNTYFGTIAKSIMGTRSATSFDKGITKFTWLMILFMAFMVPTVFIINGMTKGNWWQAFLFAISVAVGLTPEMLPAIVAINLSQGAVNLSKKKVIVKRLNSIQNFGAMDVLCTDKTGTLTQNHIVLMKHVNLRDEEDERVFQYSFLNSFHQTGFRNLMDSAIISHGTKENYQESLGAATSKLDEIPFDFKRKRLSVVVEDEKKKRFMVCKGAVEEVLATCTQIEMNKLQKSLTPAVIRKIQTLSDTYSREGFRVIAVAYKPNILEKKRYTYEDESRLTFLGLVTFLDPPKESALPSINTLNAYGITVKVLTGDNELVSKKICSDVKLKNTHMLLGPEIESMSDEELTKRVDGTGIFARLSPEHKKRIVLALQRRNHVVGFLGDGVNDAPALRTADVGISVDEAVDIAKESADIILLEKSLTVLADGVTLGRKVFGNIIKYIKMGASSNFGNMFSVLGASVFLPFLPMAPIQVLTNNLLYDISQTGIPTDNVDKEYLEKPRKWNIDKIAKFVIFIGPISSIFDYATYFLMLYIFHAWKNPALFQTGWFVESLLSQTLIVHMIRSSKIAFVETRASTPMLITTGAVMIAGILLTLSPVGRFLGFVLLPSAYWMYLIGILMLYIILTQIVKIWYIRRFGYD